MRILITGDLHLTDKKPENRLDNYSESVLKKFEFILNTAIKEKCQCILQPGDFFNAPNLSYSFFIDVFNLIQKKHITVLTIAGQHDMRMRLDQGTILSALSTTCDYVKNHEPFFDLGNEIYLFTASFNKSIPTPYPETINSFNILMTHRMVVQDKIWAGQKNYDTGLNLLEKHPGFNLIITGDNHQNFVIEKDDRVLINAGSMMRSTIAQVDFQPKIYIVEIDKNKIVDLIEIDIPIEPAETVFKMENVAREKSRDAQVDAFIDGLSQHKQQDLLFEDDLIVYMKENNFDQEDMVILSEARILEAK
jgi:DNA repair exonuclease SbcCD nuclease subunit